MIYILEGLILTVLAADMSGIHGRWAKELGLPFGGVAEGIWVVVPIVFLAVAIPPIRKQLGHFHHLVNIFAICCVILPLLIFFAQTSEVRLSDFPNTEASRQIREQFHGQVLVVGGSGGTRAYVSNAKDRDDVADVIFALDPTVKPTNTEPPS